MQFLHATHINAVSFIKVILFLLSMKVSNEIFFTHHTWLLASSALFTSISVLNNWVGQFFFGIHLEHKYIFDYMYISGIIRLWDGSVLQSNKNCGWWIKIEINNTLTKVISNLRLYKQEKGIKKEYQVKWISKRKRRYCKQLNMLNRLALEILFYWYN